jgi:hypothetical protein
MAFKGNDLWKVTTEWEYKDKYFNSQTWEFADAPSSDQSDNQVDNQTSDNVDNKNSQENVFSKYEDLYEELRNIWDRTLIYKINNDTIFSFTKDGCHIKDSGKEINFKRRWGYYKVDDPNISSDTSISMYMDFHSINIFNLSSHPRSRHKIYYDSCVFEWYTSNWNPKEWIMTYNDGSKFEWDFIVWGTIKKGEPHNVDFRDDDFWSNNIS